MYVIKGQSFYRMMESFYKNKEG